jgi:hypothetical protein
MHARERVEALIRATRSLGDAALRASYAAGVMRACAEAPGGLAELARALDAVCRRAEQAEPAARDTLVAIVDALNAENMDAIVQRLREEAAGGCLLALERLVRHPVRAPAFAASAAPAALLRERVPADARGGRPLTLGERKWLARRSDRDTLQRLLRDPHPDVVRRCLRNPRITEDDVVRLAALRPGRAAPLAEIARSTRWSHRPRVRVALVMNPATPPEIAARIAGLLRRPELQLVARSPAVPPSVRAICLEHLERRPPVEDPSHEPGRVH